MAKPVTHFSRIALLGAALLSNPALAADPTINDLPGILLKLRGCSESKSLFSGSACKTAKEDLWASVDSDGSLTLFRKRSYGNTTYASGRNVTELLRDFATKINDERDAGKEMLDVLAPYLSTQ
jgi:hypothetical protein